MKQFLLGLPIFFFTILSLFAQVAEESPTADEAAGVAGALAGAGCGCFVFILALGLQIAIAVWVYRDAKARGMENAILLTVLAIFTGLLGLLIYILMRPKGNLVACPSCQKKRLEGSAKCPHCGNP